jgi:4-methyl-5(b-hydroxyethyl)-thiazole monophosphate biosynthesis
MLLRPTRAYLRNHSRENLLRVSGFRIYRAHNVHQFPRTCLSLISTFSTSSPAPVLNPKVLIPVADGTEEIEAITIADILVRAGGEVSLSSVMPGRKEVKLSRGVTVVTDSLMDESITYHWDLICLPGGMPGAKHLSDCSSLISLLRTHHSQGKLIGAICASPAMILAKYGFLEGGGHGQGSGHHRFATCYPSDKFVDMLGSSYTSSHDVVVDGNIITSKGPGTAMEFSLVLTEALFGKSKADSLREELCHPNKKVN